MEKVLRSLIHEKFPFELRVKLDLLSRRRDIINREKQEELIKLLREFNIEGVVQLGAGTNRYAFRLDGFVIKVATDRDGKIDNLKEFKMAKRLFPYVTKTYEVSQNGTILVAEYIQPFTSYAEMLKHADRIREILAKLSTVYLIGDVGISSINYSNWGLRIGTDEPVCLDFAYVYNVSSDIFICRYCNNGTMLVPNKDFTELLCPNKACGHKYTFADIRARLGDDIHMHEIGDLSDEGYLMSTSKVPTVLDEKRSNYLARKKEKQETKNNQKVLEETFIDDFKLSNIKEDKEMIKKFRLSSGAVINVDASLKVDVSNNTPSVTPEVKPVEVEGNASTSTASQAEHSLAFSGKVIQAEAVSTKEVKPVEKEDEDFRGVSVSVPIQPIEVKDKNGRVHTFDSVELPPIQHPEPVTADTEQVKTEQKVESTKAERKHYDSQKKHRFDNNFLSNMEKAISKLSNRIGNNMHEILLFDDVRANIKDKKMYPDTFYKNIQNAIFRSLMIFCNFTERDVPNVNGKGTHKEFTAPENVVGEVYEPTLIFLNRFWNNREINSMEIAGDIMTAYDNMYSDYRGIQTEWIDVLSARIAEKMPIDKVAIPKITDTIKKLWCDPVSDSTIVEEDNVEDEVEEVTPSDTTPLNSFDGSDETPELSEEDVDDDSEIEADEQLPDEVEEDFETDDEVAFSGSLVESDEEYEEDFEEEDFDDEEEDDIDEEDEEDGHRRTFVSIRRNVRNKGYDLVKLYTADDYEEICIPFYTHIDENDGQSTMTSSTDDRNGVWDWMIHFMPDYRFYTETPEYWLDFNNVMEGIKSIFRFVILDSTDKDHVLMGLTVFDGVIEVDENENETLVTDQETLGKINKLIINNCGYSEISHLSRSFDEDEISDELEVKLIIDHALNSYYEGDEDYETEEVDYEDEIESDDDSEFSDAEAAAIAALMGGSPDKKSIPKNTRVIPIVNDINDKEEDFDNDREEAQPTLLTPIRRVTK